MENKQSIHLQEIIFSSRDANISRQITKFEEEGIIKKISPRIYTTNLTETPASIIKRNIFHVIANLYPGALLSHRTALEFKPTETGDIFLTYTYTKKIKIPGITINFLEGHKPIEGDNPFAGNLFASQKERALLENLKSPLAVARVFGVPYDSARVELFQILFQELQQREFNYFPDKNTSKQAYRNFAFFEAYFSNYIEGTIFEIDDAKKIIETQMPIPTRNEDSHDVLGTYELVSNQIEMSIVPKTKEEFLNIILYRHKILLSARTSKKPRAV